MGWQEPLQVLQASNQAIVALGIGLCGGAT
jgi:hypothetical protein